LRVSAEIHESWQGGCCRWQSGYTEFSTRDSDPEKREEYLKNLAFELILD